MTAPDETMARRLDRRAGGCLIAVGVLLLTTVPHPDVFETTFADAALDTPSWVVTHAALVVAAILSIFGLAGVYLPAPIDWAAWGPPGSPSRFPAWSSPPASSTGRRSCSR